MTVLRAGEKVEVLAQTDFEEPILATPALAREHLSLRTESALYAIGEQSAVRAR